MKKALKNKGGVGEIIALVIVVGIVLALIISVVVPMMQTAQSRGKSNRGMQNGLDTSITGLNT